MRFPFLGVYNNAKSNLFPANVLYKHRIFNLVGFGRNIEPFHRGLSLEARFQQPVICFLAPSETRFLGSGRGGHSVLPWVNNRSIDIANGCTSGRFVAKTPFVFVGSGASCPTLSPDEIVLELETTFPLVSSEIFVIPESQTS